MSGDIFYDFLEACVQNNVNSSHFIETFPFKPHDVCILIQCGVKTHILKQILDNHDHIKNYNDMFYYAVMYNRFYILHFLKKRFLEFTPSHVRCLFFNAFVENKNYEIVFFLEKQYHFSLIDYLPMHCWKNILEYKLYKDLILKNAANKIIRWWRHKK
jgi:hypothetical protein